MKIILCVFILLFVRLFLMFFKAFIFKTLKKYSWFDQDRGKQIYRLVKLLLYLVGIVLFIYVLDLHATWSEVMGQRLIDTGQGEDGKGPGITITIGGTLIFFIVLFFVVF